MNFHMEIQKVDTVGMNSGIYSFGLCINQQMATSQSPPNTQLPLVSSYWIYMQGVVMTTFLYY